MQQRKAHPVTHSKNKDFHCLPSTDWVNVCVLCITQVAHYVWNKKDFDAVDPETTDYLMGEFCLFLIVFYPLVVFFPGEWYMKVKCSHQTPDNHKIRQP